MKQLIKEVVVNTFSSKQYYTNTIIPSIALHGTKWKKTWKNKTPLMLSYDLDESKDIVQLPRLLLLLEKYNLKASFAVIGLLAKRNPGMFRKIIDAGHEIINHTETHPNSQEFNKKHFHKIEYEERYWEIEECHKTMKDLFGYEMNIFRVPHFGFQHTDDIYNILKELKYKASSSTVAIKTPTYGYPYKVNGVWELPMICCSAHPYCIFDTSHAFRSILARHGATNYLKTFDTLLTTGVEHQFFINLYQDPQDIPKFDYEKMLQMIDKRRDDLSIMNYNEIVKSIEQ